MGKGDVTFFSKRLCGVVGAVAGSEAESSMDSRMLEGISKAMCAFYYGRPLG